MIFISKYYIINILIAQFNVAIEILFAILCLTFLYCLHSTLSLHLNKIFCLINFVSTNSQRILNEFSTNSQRILNEFSTNSQRILNEFSTNSQRIIFFIIINQNYLFSLKKLKFPELRFSGT
jgi:hypothetical protein